MKISAYQPKKRNASGMLRLYFVLNHANERAFVNTKITTLYPIIKTGGAGMGFVLNKKEPAMRPKMKRLEDLYWKIDEYAVAHPIMRAMKVKEAIEGVDVKKGQLIDTMVKYADSGKVGESTAGIIKRTAAKIEEYDPTAGFSVNEDWLDEFSTYLKNHNTKTNGIAIHLRNIRTVFNWARRKGLTKEYPFLDYKIKQEKVVIRNMSLQTLRQLRDYTCEAWQREYRDLFMLMFYLAGVNIGDLILSEGLTNGRFICKRRKTGAVINLPVYPEAMEIIDRYKGTKHLLSPMDRYKDYYGYLHKINDGLKKIGRTEIVKDKAGKLRKHKITPLYDGLSTYVARYTFASIAAECGISRDIIAACLGHSWADVTSHYIAYSQKQIDDAIRKVIDYVNQK